MRALLPACSRVPLTRGRNGRKTANARILVPRRRMGHPSGHPSPTARRRRRGPARRCAPPPLPRRPARRAKRFFPPRWTTRCRFRWSVSMVRHRCSSDSTPRARLGTRRSRTTRWLRPWARPRSARPRTRRSARRAPPAPRIRTRASGPRSRRTTADARRCARRGRSTLSQLRAPGASPGRPGRDPEPRASRSSRRRATRGGSGTRTGNRGGVCPASSRSSRRQDPGSVRYPTRW